MVQYDRSVRTPDGRLIQFLYGEDAMDGRWVRACLTIKCLCYWNSRLHLECDAIYQAHSYLFIFIAGLSSVLFGAYVGVDE